MYETPIMLIWTRNTSIKRPQYCYFNHPPFYICVHPQGKSIDLTNEDSNATYWKKKKKLSKKIQKGRERYKKFLKFFKIQNRSFFILECYKCTYFILFIILFLQIDYKNRFDGSRDNCSFFEEMECGHLLFQSSIPYCHCKAFLRLVTLSLPNIDQRVYWRFPLSGFSTLIFSLN